MNEVNAAALALFAEKIGTTTEYLWSVLINQAPVFAITSIIIFSVTLFINIAGGIHLYYMSIPRQVEGRNYKECKLDMDKGLHFAYVVFICLATVINFLMFMINFIDVINAIYSPEYWALSQIIGKK